MRRLMPLLALLFSCLFVVPAHAAGPTGLLNDTGQSTCSNGTALVACATANTGDAATYPRQDGRFGRDKAGMAKTGGGAAGFDFTKLCWSGDAEGSGICTGTLVANTGNTANIVTPATDWACTRDNVTNLVWSLQTLTFVPWTSATNTFGGSLIDDTNLTRRCGFASGWRVPTRRELLSIVHSGVSNPAIDSAYFPGTDSGWYWSNDVYAPDAALAWSVNFLTGYTVANSKTYSGHVRLVRSGQ